MTFADPSTDLLFDKSHFTFSVNGDLISGTLSTQSGDVYVDEGAGSGAQTASQWILTRLAHTRLLAARMRDSVPTTAHFISPAASLLPTLSRVPQDAPTHTNDALQTATETITARSPLETTVLYITSDAGEGKTSVINEMARQQALAYIENRSDWLLVPIPLGGRHFLRFDDITVGALQNRYRFPFLYYDAFIALTRMGVIVPAFDGFEEMFVESSSGEALSAMGILLAALDSRGTIVVAARKAYFEFENLRTKAVLFDNIRELSVGFAKLELHRWGSAQFLSYCRKRNLSDPEVLYHRVCDRIGASHALLTRAVLVKRLADVAMDSPSLDALLEKIQVSGPDFFSVFVRSIVEREAQEKWIDRSGKDEIGAPLLSVDEHIELLAQVAVSMWESRLDYLKRDSLEFVSDYFCESTGKSSHQAQQIRERLRGHALLVSSPNAQESVEFDHDEFRLFFLGEGIARQLMAMNDRAKAQVLSILRRGVLPSQAQQSLVRAVTRSKRIDAVEAAKVFIEVGAIETQSSHTHENCSELALMLLSGSRESGLQFKNMSFGVNALRDRDLFDVEFLDCYFAATSLEHVTLRNCKFVGTRFAQLGFASSTAFENVRFDGCEVDAIALVEQQHEIWDPPEIQRVLAERGVVFKDGGRDHDSTDEAIEVEEAVRNVEKLTRYFMRSTHISESVILLKVGPHGKQFVDTVVPRLQRRGILEEIPNLGSGTQRRFRLGVPLQVVRTALSQCQGSFERFLEHV